jgi:hypothetical protein
LCIYHCVDIAPELLSTLDFGTHRAVVSYIMLVFTILDFMPVSVRWWISILVGIITYLVPFQKILPESLSPGMSLAEASNVPFFA